MSTTETTYTTSPYPGETTILHTWTITDEAGTAAALYVDMDHHMIMNIEVRDDRQGEGLARHLYETAEAQLGEIYHVPTWGCTPEGEAFAEAMGGEVMDDETAAQITGFDLTLLDAA